MPYQHRPTTALQVGAYSVVLYDWLLCFADEVDFLSTPGISIAKVVYTLCRYWPIITHPISLYIEYLPHGALFCPAHSKIPLYLGIINLGLAAAVLTLRLYAFTGCQRSIAIGLPLAALAVLAYQYWAVSSLFANSKIGPQTCFLTNVEQLSPKETLFAQNLLGGYFLAPLSFDFLTLVIFIVHACRTLDLRLNSLPLITGLSRTFIQHGFVYFFAISAVNTVNTVLSHKAPTMYGCAWLSNVCTVLTILLPNTLACRLVLELRNAARRPTYADGTTLLGSNIESFTAAANHDGYSSSRLERDTHQTIVLDIRGGSSGSDAARRGEFAKRGSIDSFSSDQLWEHRVQENGESLKLGTMNGRRLDAV
ncbi:hypothetical protein BKA62DRAFT_45477 [Auriculariales sp. MPI-PUGE-AT-0066]|nr:hypothetical protein BKA62DRAFT_45477 [Auriculariales sp. MPI-PUGE-AT-0066]